MLTCWVVIGKASISVRYFVSRHILVLSIGVACLELFLQYNWTGPTPQSDAVLPNTGNERSNQQILATLSQDGQVQHACMGFLQ